MGAEQLEGAAGEDGAGSAAAADAASCIVRRFVIDPGRNVVRDGSGQTVAFLMGAGGEALGAGSAGAKFALGIGRKLVGAETPDAPAAGTVEP